MLSVTFIFSKAIQNTFQSSEMSIFKKILRRKSSISNQKDSSSSLDKVKADELADDIALATEDSGAAMPCIQNQKNKKHNKGEHRHTHRYGKDDIPYRPFLFDSRSSSSTEPGLSDSDEERAHKSLELSTSESTTEERMLTEFVDKQSQRLATKLQKLKKQRERLRRKQSDVISLEKEIRHVIAMISNIKKQTTALNEDVITKKCELKFIATQVPEGCEADAKKKEPVLYKKYTNIKSSNDAKNLLTLLQQKIRAMQYLELLTYNKTMEYRYGLKRNPIIKKAFGQFTQKNNHFDHITECLQPTQPAKVPANQPSKIDNLNNSEPTFAVVTIEIPPVSTSLPEMTPVSPTTPPAPPLPQHLGLPYLPLSARHETFI